VKVNAADRAIIKRGLYALRRDAMLLLALAKTDSGVRAQQAEVLRLDTLAAKLRLDIKDRPE
jgi:hypothetical protein